MILRWCRSTRQQSRAPFAGRRSCAHSSFNPRPPRGERQAGTRRHRLRADVSIHAPARGATVISSPSDGIRSRFNPRPHEGSDLAPSFGIELDAHVSIHAPARGATGLDRSGRANRSSFNPRSREGSDSMIASWSSTLRWFQSTLPRAERLAAGAARSAGFRVSIHAPARGATDLRTLLTGPLVVSIHAPARGATHDRRLQLGRAEVSIHAPREGSDHARRGSIPARASFNPRPPRGERRRGGGRRVPHSRVSIHAPREGATRRRRPCRTDR